MHYQSVKRTPGQTRAFTDKHLTLSKSFNQPMTAARRRQGQQLSAGHGPPRRLWPLPLASASCGTEATQPNPEASPLEAWPCECNAEEESAERTGVQWRNPTGGGDKQFWISLQHQRDHERGGTHGLPACTEINTGYGAQPQRGK